MQYCLSLSPTIDKTVDVDGFVLNATNRAVRVRMDAGGKAINVAMVLKELGADPRVLGVSSRLDAEIFREALEARSIFYDFHEVDQPARVNMKIHDTKTGKTTEVNEPGFRVSEELLQKCADEIVSLPKSGEIVVLAGSLPQGAKPSLYADIVSRLKKKNVLTAVDASGEALKLAVKEGPWLIKPNLDELSELVGKELRTIGDVSDACAEIIEKDHVHTVLVSLGAKGLYLARTDEKLFAPGLDIDVQSTVGAGDSVVAAAIARLDSEAEEMLRAGAAAGAAAASTEGTTPFTKKAFDDFYARIKIVDQPDGTVVITDRT